MATVSYRLYCQECDNEEVLRRKDLDESPWRVENLGFNEGLCPRCNDSVSLDNIENGEEYAKSLRLESLDNIGETAAENLREEGYDTSEAIASASDEEILAVSWVGEAGLFSLKEAAKELEPQKRWDE